MSVFRRFARESRTKVEGGNALTRSETFRDPWLRWALALALLFHGSLLVAGSYQNTYDAWVHIFFGDHYARDWFSTWEPRWYTGFTVTSYPPASHQGIGMLSRLFGLETAFVILQLGAALNIVVGVYRFSLLWVSRQAAGWAALLAVASSSLAEVIHTFGQLPTTMALGFLLNAQPSIRRWVHDGIRIQLVASIVLLAATTAGHHVTTLFGTVFFTGPVVVRAVFDRLSDPLHDEPPGHVVNTRLKSIRPQVARRVRRVLPAFMRAGVLGFLIVCTLVTIVLPYWLWSSSDPITQVSIPHASRNSFINDTAAGLVFWLVPWASLLLIVPFAFAKAALGRGWPLAASIALLALLGTGGTTPIPRLMLGGAFDILTLDRFTIWATIAVLPFAGWVFTSVRNGALRSIGVARLGRLAPNGFMFVAIVGAIASTMFAATLTNLRPFQPRSIDPTPITSFMSKDQHDRWRYLSLGFGDQMAWVSANTTALTVDGNYHSARRLPELTSRSVERLEGAKYRGIPGIGSLQQFLINPSPYHLKFVFSIDSFYDPLLWSAGWQRIGILDNDVEVWERADVPPLPDALPVREIPGWQRAMWGTLPMTSATSGVFMLIWLGTGRRLPRRLRPLSRETPGAGRILRRIDGRLKVWASRMRGDTSVVRVPWSPVRWRVESAVAQAAQPSSTGMRRALQASLAIVVLLPVILGAMRQTDPLTPEETVAQYYSALDFQQFDDAHGFLDPELRPDLASYLLGVSVRDGLLDGYSELDSVTSVVTELGDRAVAQVELIYVTSVEQYQVLREHSLRQRDGEWFIEPAEVDIEPPTDQLVRRPEVAVSTLGRSSETTGRTSFDDILDRPRLAMAPSRTYRLGDRWIIVGAVTNVDVDPADVTINGILRDEDGERLAVYDANQSSVHQVLPGETVPFRIEFEERAGAFDRSDPAAGDFDPLAYAEPVIEAEVDVVEVSSRAVITGGQLERVVDVTQAAIISTVGISRAGDDPIDDAAIEDEVVDDEPLDEAELEIARLEERAAADKILSSAAADIAAANDGVSNGVAFDIRLRNTGTTPATITRVSVTYVDADNEVVWVDHHWVPDSVRPQRTTRVQWETDFPELTEVDIETNTFDNAKVGGQEGEEFGSDVTFAIEGEPPVIAGHEITQVRLDVTSFQRQVEP